MEEKIIIQSKQSDIQKLRKIFFIVGIVAAAILILQDVSSILDAISPEYIRKYGADDAILFGFVIPCAIGFAPMALIGQIFYMAMSKIEMTVTTKRVYGKALFGKRVDLPMDSVSAIGSKWPMGIAVSTSSGKIDFLMIKNRDEIHKCVSELLIERQSKIATAPTTTIKQEIPQSNAEELKKYKELLDMGVITQEEFDSKKKQLLGL